MRQMIICDCHVHIYPSYDLWQFLDSAWNNLHYLAPNSEAKVLCLTERYDCHFFKQCQQGEISHRDIVFRNHNDAIEVILNDGRAIWIIAGRQINTAERIEILALTKDLEVNDGLPFKETLAAVQKGGALAAINWAPGKWFFKRGTIVASAIENYSPESLLFCDTTLRCIGWPEPRLMKKAAAKGFKIIAGSDPLPAIGEEKIVGNYCVIADSKFNADAPTISIRSILGEKKPLTRRGRRSLPWEMIKRISSI